jgi:hypothetical protein
MTVTATGAAACATGTRVAVLTRRVARLLGMEVGRQSGRENDSAR